MPREQLRLPIGPLRNRDLFSTHWLEKRLPLEPEWNELRDIASETLAQLGTIWQTQRSRVSQYGDEQGLEEAFIQPVLRELGWKLKYQTFLQGRGPDYALFSDDESLDRAIQIGRTAPEFWSYATVVADAKAWHVSLDRPSVVNNQKEYPPQQIEWYLDRSRLGFGILTNGQTWRLIPREYGPQQRRFQTYLEFHLSQLLDRWVSHPSLTEQVHLNEEFLYFFLFFGPAAFVQVDSRARLIKRAIEGSSEYRIGVSEGLKGRAFKALRFCIEGFLSFPENELSPNEDLMVAREQSFIFLYRLLFIMYAEDRRLLPYGTNRSYTNNRSLRRHRDEIAARLEQIARGRENDYSREETNLWADLVDLFDLVDRGHRTYGVAAYNGGLFDIETNPFLTQKQISDWYLARIIDQLGRARDPDHPTAGLFRVDYHDLAIQHLGAIYEGLLELKPHYATERMQVIVRSERSRLAEKVIPFNAATPSGYTRTAEFYESGSIYLLTDKGERRATGSYYTPDHIVNYIVERTLGPLCTRISETLYAEIAEVEREYESASDEPVRTRLASSLARLKRDFDDRVLQLRLLDPAMGSGHFLLRACQYLAEEIATHPYAADESSVGVTSEGESSMTFWKRQVVEHCLHGIDMNPLAVELAKLALWLETVAVDRPLSFLDHHLRYGNSLVGARIANVGVLPGEVEIISANFMQQVERQMHLLLKPLRDIRQAPSETTAQVKKKEKFFQAFEKVREPFREVADLWCSFVSDENSELTSEQYQTALDLIAQPNRFRRLQAEPWFEAAVRFARRPELICFHWELEFPEAFFDDDGRRANPGFDAVIGNPPYDVMSELETGKDLSALRAFIEVDQSLVPSRRGKNNLYKLFICRALEVLAEKGIFGFITPMAVLGDDQAADVRREIVEVGAFTGIEAFPQKDDPTKRVFPEAKLSTAVFTIAKDNSEDANARPFVSRVHPERTIEITSPSLTLTTNSIPLYDPLNFTIVSSSQADWDLATRIMQTGRMDRLRQFAEFFQGEVNETNERARGNLANDSNSGKLVTRGASICLYVPRAASQGQDIFLRVERFLSDKGLETKAFHHRHPRVGLQESSPQNNFRRIIAALVPAGEFCNHTVNYCPANKCSLDLRLLLGLLNSKLADWYFRLGSTNAHVSHYQLYNLPCPLFAQQGKPAEGVTQEKAIEALRAGAPANALAILAPLLARVPFSLAIRDAVIEAVEIIGGIEAKRGEISRSARSALEPAAQPFQDFIDQLLYKMAGLSESESRALEDRLAQML